MANIAQNDQYQSTAALKPVVSRGFKYTPSTTYQNLAMLKAGGGSPFDAAPAAMPGTFEYDQAKQSGVSQYGRLLNEGMGIPTQQQFLPPEGNRRTPIPIPSDYGTFMEPMSFESNGEKLSWGSPQDPVIRNMPGEIPGQYVQDRKNPSMLVKTNRGSNPVADQAIRDGRPGFMYQIDHIMPLYLGGADTLANRQLLTSEQNDKKTRMQAVPYTLYAHGDITLDEARIMAMQWKDRDLTDVPQPNSLGLVSDVGGKTGIEIAREVRKRWDQPKGVGIKEVIGGIPEAAKNLGEGWLPDSVREFVKGFGSGATLGFVPYEQDDGEGKGAWLSGKVGQVVGGVASFLLGGALIGGALKGVGMARGAITAYKGAANAKALASGFKAAEGAASLAENAVSQTTFKSLNKAPSYLRKLVTPETVARAGKFGAANVLVGQAHQFIANKFNPGTLSGQEIETDQENVVKQMLGDLALGASGGILPSTIKGTAGAVMMPLTLTYLANPDDPLDAITNGVIFGALHGAGSYKMPGFNDVKALGGKPYVSPNIKAFEDAVNTASYSSLSHYAPNILPPLKAGQKLSPEVFSPEKVQAARDAAIENVWKRFFFGKDTSIGDLKKYSEGLESKLESSSVPELKGLDRLSLSARKARSSELKNKNAEIEKEFGPGYQKRNEFQGTISEDMDLQTALTEVKRITVASRQLYKGGLSKELRDKADVDDLLSFSKNNLQGKFNEQEKFLNPPIAKQAVDSLDESFMQHSFNNDTTPVSGKYPSGDIALTGAALNINKENAKYFFEQRASGNASPNIILVDRTDTAPIWRMRNQLLDPNDVKLKNYAEDPNPEHALQAFGVVKNAKGGKELVPLGWVASDFRLNLATGKGHEAFNQHPLVKKWKNTNGAEGMKPIDLNKDQVAQAMKRENISVLVANLDPRATLATIESGNPFIPLNVKDRNWEYSKQLGDRLAQQENTNPISMEIAKVNNALTAKQKSDAIASMKKKVIKPASSYIPETVRPVNPKEDRLVVPQETTRSLIQDVEQSLDVAGPQQVKEAFKSKFGILLEDSQAQAIFSRRTDLTLRDGVKLLVEAVNNGDASIATKLKMQFTKTYLESGALQASDAGKAILDMPLLGKVKEKPVITGQEEHTVTPIAKKPSAAQPVKETISLPKTAVAEEPTGVAPASGLADRVVLKAKQETIKSVPKSEPSTVSNEEVVNLSKDFIPEALSAIDNAKGGYFQDVIKSHDQAYADIAKIIQANLSARGVSNSVIEAVEDGVMRQMRKRSAEILETDSIKKLVEGGMSVKRATQTVQSALSTGDSTIPLPQVKSNEFFSSIEKGLKSDSPAALYNAKAMDAVFKHLFGEKYKNNPTLAKFTSTIHPWGADFWNNQFFNDVNAAGREIKQHKDIVNARASGDRNAEMKAYSDRRNQLKENPTEEGGGMTDKEKADLGIESDSMANGMRVTPWYQEDNMIGNLTQGENLMSGIVSDLPLSGATSVRDIKRLFIGTGKDTPGLLQYMNKRLLEDNPKARKLSIPATIFEKLEKEAAAADASAALKEAKMKADIAEAESQVPALRAKIEKITQQMKNNDPEDPLPAWQTPEIMSANVKDIMEKIQKYSKILDSQKKDGGGGPGFHDGAGGFGDWFKSASKTAGKAIGKATITAGREIGKLALAGGKAAGKAAGNVVVSAWKNINKPSKPMVFENPNIFDIKKKKEVEPTPKDTSTPPPIRKFKKLDVPKREEVKEVEKPSDLNNLVKPLPLAPKPKPVVATSEDIEKNKQIVSTLGRDAFGDAEVESLMNLVQGESGFRHTVGNAEGSSAYGLFQFMPNTWKGYAPELGVEKTDDPEIQTKKGIEYIRKRYGTPTRALLFWKSTVTGDPSIAPEDLRQIASIWVSNGYRGF